MNASQIAIEVRSVARRCAGLIAERQRAEAEEVRETALRCKPLLEELWKSTTQRLELYLACGSPISILRLVGESHLEKPFNRILKWCATERAEHGFGREFLKKLCAHLHFDEMTKDLEACEKIEIRGEEILDSSGNMPDLVVWTPKAVLMLENKLRSGASGNQYDRYIKWFRDFANSRKKKGLAVLSAPDDREWPCEWDKFMRHRELAQVFRDVAKAPEVPVWGRIVAIQCAVTLENAETDLIAELIHATKHKGRVGIRDWRTALAAQPPAQPAKPWE
jgi:hypothetical protein